MEVRSAVKEDFLFIEQLEKECFSIPWTYDDLLESFENPMYHFFVAVEDACIVGYAGMTVVLDEADVTNIVVTEEKRGRGFGRALVEALIREARACKAERVFLEVRESNEKAIKLYESLSFEKIGYRKNFYQFPMEAAVLYALTL